MPTILVVDDNAQNRALAQAALEDEGYRAVLAADGQEALAAFAAERPDCVLLDVRMPEMDGFAVCAPDPALPGGADTPIIFLTSLCDGGTFDSALRAGGDDFLGKPVPLPLRDKVFERFVRVDTGDRPATRAGRGLGLAFCKLAVETHGGTIQVEDGEPGAVFRVTLPDPD